MTPGNRTTVTTATFGTWTSRFASELAIRTTTLGCCWYCCHCCPATIDGCLFEKSLAKCVSRSVVASLSNQSRKCLLLLKLKWQLKGRFSELSFWRIVSLAMRMNTCFLLLVIFYQIFVLFGIMAIGQNVSNVAPKNKLNFKRLRWTRIDFLHNSSFGNIFPNLHFGTIQIKCHLLSRVKVVVHKKLNIKVVIHTLLHPKGE